MLATQYIDYIKQKSQNPMTFNSRPKKISNKGEKLNKINMKTDSLGQPPQEFYHAPSWSQEQKGADKKWFSRKKEFCLLVIGL